jgi:hypothetical protein
MNIVSSTSCQPQVLRRVSLGGNNRGYRFTEYHIPHLHNNVTDYLVRLVGKVDPITLKSMSRNSFFQGGQPIEWMIWRGAVPRGVIRQLLKQMDTTFLLPKSQASN